MPRHSQEAPALDAVAGALADTTRREMMRLVRQREVSAGELATHFPQMSRPATSQHLRVLHDAGLVEVRSEGSRRLYRARIEGLTALATYLDEFWADRLTHLKNAAERSEWPQRQRDGLDRRTADRPPRPPADTPSPRRPRRSTRGGRTG